MANNAFYQEEQMLVVKPSSHRKNTRGKTLPRWASLPLLLAPLVVVSAAGQTRQEKTFETTANPRIGLSNFTGTVVVKGWDKSQVHAVYVTASPQVTIEMDQLPASGAAEKVHFTTRVPNTSASGPEKSASYTLEVPIGASLDIRNPEGKVEVEKLLGDASVESAGAVISLRDVSGRISVNSVTGDIEIIRSAGRVDATSICGNLYLVAPTGSALKAQSSSGKVVFRGDFVPAGEYWFKNYSGDIDLFVPPTASFELDHDTVRGTFVSEITPAHRAKSYTPQRDVHTFLGSNISSTAAVRLKSFSGNIHIHSQSQSQDAK
jgi:DUF4097 and DUF4098 domain-containing protein YvlB